MSECAVIRRGSAVRVSIVLLVALTVAVLAGAGTSAIGRVRVERLPIDEAFGVNNAGKVVGSDQIGECGGRPVAWSRSGTNVLTAGGECGVAVAINDREGIVGWYLPKYGSADTAFHWHGVLSDVAPLPRSVVISEAADLNDHDAVAGTTDVWWDENTDEDPTTWSEPRARLWYDQKMVDLGNLGGGKSVARAVNNRDQVVGESTTRSGNWHAFLWDRGKLRDLGTLGGKTSAALDINDREEIVGYSGTATGATHAVIWQKGRLIDLGVLPGGRNSSAHAINQRGQVVGSSDRGSWGQAFLWQNSRMTQLTLPGGWMTASATAINDRGQIVGTAARTHHVPYTETAILWTLPG